MSFRSDTNLQVLSVEINNAFVLLLVFEWFATGSFKKLRFLASPCPCLHITAHRLNRYEWKLTLERITTMLLTLSSFCWSRTAVWALYITTCVPFCANGKCNASRVLSQRKMSRAKVMDTKGIHFIFKTIFPCLVAFELVSVRGSERVRTPKFFHHIWHFLRL